MCSMYTPFQCLPVSIAHHTHIHKHMQRAMSALFSSSSSLSLFPHYSCMYRWCCLKHKKPVSETTELVTMREVENSAAANEPEPIYEEFDLDDLRKKPSHSMMLPTTTAMANSTWMDRSRLQREQATHTPTNS